MALSINSKQIILSPISQSYSNIQIDNVSGKIDFNLGKENISLEDIDKVIENLNLAKKISIEIKGGKK